MSHPRQMWITGFLSYLYSFNFLLFYIALVRVPSIVLKRSEESGQPCLIPGFNKIAIYLKREFSKEEIND